MTSAPGSSEEPPIAVGGQEPIATAMPAPAPVALANRIPMLDVLRGVAVLGILAINIPGFALAWDGVPWSMDVAVEWAVDEWIWILANVFIEGTMRGLFSLLFGAGIILFTSRLEARLWPGRARLIYYRRNLWLVCFGLVHSYVLLWYGDILYYYGMTGLWLYFLRHVRARVLIAVGACLMAVPLIPTAFDHASMIAERSEVTAAQAELDAGRSITAEQQETLDDWNGDRTFDEDEYNQQIETMRSGYWTIATSLAVDNLWEQTIGLVKWSPWDVGSFMMIGMALMKLRVLTGERSRAFYLRLMLVGYGVGLTVNVTEEIVLRLNDFDPMVRPIKWYTYDLARIAMTLGHVGLVALLVKSGAVAKALGGLAATGRMALTNYISQSVICGLLFYGVGFGLYNRLTASGLALVVFAIWAFQIAFSVWWLRRFQFGPLEWLWRSLTYWKVQPLRGNALHAPYSAG